MTQEIEIKVDNGVQIIRILRADKKNALTGPMYDAMSAALDSAEKSDAVAAHVFIGSGGVFTAGNDINDFMRRSRDGSQGRGALADVHPAPAQGDAADDRRGRRSGRRGRRDHAAALRPGLRHAGGELPHAVRRPGADPGGGLERAGTGAARLRRAPSSCSRWARRGVPPAPPRPASSMPWCPRTSWRPRRWLPPDGWPPNRAPHCWPPGACCKGDPALISKAIADEVSVYKDLMRSPEAKEAFTAFLEKRPPDFAKARRGG